MAALSADLLFSPSGLLVAALLLLLVLILPYTVPTLLHQWGIYTALKQLPCDPDQHWLLGHAPKTMDDLGASMDFYLNLSLKYGNVLRMNYGPFFNSAELLHPDTIQVALGPDPKYEVAYAPLKPWLGNGLLLSSGKKWGRNRRLLTRAFHFDVLRPYVKVYSEASSVLVNIWLQKCKEGSINVCPYMKNLTLDVMLRCTCSYQSDCQTKQSSYVNAVYELPDLVVKRVMFFPAYYDWVYALMPEGWRFKKLCDLVHKFAMDIIRKRRTELKEMKERGEDLLTTSDGKTRRYLDFIDVLLEARDDEGHGLTDEEIRAEVDTFLFEGHDTTSAALCWTLYNLARFPDHQEKCREEVDKIFKEKGQIEWDDLKRLTYLKYCIKESLRLFPPVPIVARELAEDRVFDGYKLRKGTWLSLYFYNAHHHPHVWENPEEFNPLRFTPENSKDRHKYAFTPFSAGPRNCIGQEFAANEELVVLSNILRNFEFSLDESHGPIKKYVTLVMYPSPGVYLHLKKR